LRILLTGATGFIGSSFARLALKRGHVVAALGLREPIVVADATGESRLTWLKGTLEDAPWGAIAAFLPEVCVHCAWSTAPRFSYDSTEHFRYLENSQVFVHRALESGVRRILGLGSCIEYRLGNEPLVEGQTPLEPLGAYAESKNAMRAWLESQSRQQGFAYCWPRLFYVYGVGEHPTRLCTSIVQKLLRDETILLKTPQSTKDYIYVEDAVSALMLLTEQRAEGDYNVGTGIGITIYDLAHSLAQLLGKPDLVQRAVPEVPDPLGYVVADNSRLRGLGWRPEYDLVRGLKTLVTALRQ
jgi:nucleoside-diphosphate-sugar epimerase